MARTRRILVTGVARWWGALLVQKLSRERDVAEIFAIDNSEPRFDLGSAEFLKLDIRHSLIGKLVRAVGVDTVVHTGTTIDSFIRDPRRAHETNVIGTLNLLGGIAGADSPVRRLVIKSSGHVYGSGPRVPAQLREDRRLAADSPHPFVRDIVEVESYASDFALRNPNVDIITLRFANSLNADEPQPFARYLDLELVPTVAGYDPPIQLVHSDDCVEALRVATLRAPAGAYNVAGGDPMPLSFLLERAGRTHAPLLPPVGLGAASALLRRMGIAYLSPQLLDLIRWGRTLSTERARRTMRFSASMTTLEALERFYGDRRVKRFQPEGPAYQYERELEEFIRGRAAGNRSKASTAATSSLPRRRPAPRR